MHENKIEELIIGSIFTLLKKEEKRCWECEKAKCEKEQIKFQKKIKGENLTLVL